MKQRSRKTTSQSTILSDILNRAFLWITIITVIGIIAVPLGLWMHMHAQAQLALGEAKNVELAISLMGKESYATGNSVFDASGAGGVRSQYINELKTFADVKGMLYLTGWDATEDKLKSFTYQTGGFTVEYEMDFTTEEEHWKVSYQIPILDY